MGQDKVDYNDTKHKKNQLIMQEKLIIQNRRKRRKKCCTKKGVVLFSKSQTDAPVAWIKKCWKFCSVKDNLKIINYAVRQIDVLHIMANEIKLKDFCGIWKMELSQHLHK